MRQTNSRDDNCLSCCACDETERMPFPECTALAMAYVPFQQRGETYSCEKALSAGTLFPCLDKPFMMGCCK
ncbi:MAG: spore coat associated protein CotJA [Clostridia bacterium]|nr:spore coat associated protein CotJA [Clostridia bacterium]